MQTCRTYTNRNVYRGWITPPPGALDTFELTAGESNLLVTCAAGLRGAASAALEATRRSLERFLEGGCLPGATFLASLRPLPRPRGTAPRVVLEMIDAARAWNVGPMAAVAGAVAESVARKLVGRSGTVIVENGGDVFAIAPGELHFAVYTGEGSPFPSSRLRFTVPSSRGVGICTSSGRIGPSLSMGTADAVVAVSGNGAFADAAATSIGNRVRSPGDVDGLLELGAPNSCRTLDALIVFSGGKLGIRGAVRLAGAPVETRKE